ncbi:TonB-dependent receptor [Asticcacaulis sp. 201]|uniref:TonB-dependent receptor n=1 Tax=Asticcacaulis sp. 201 TaxID=3028787 RepID=UPI002916BB76|nr:TonB-dependent receptor [Asticcacaulis sp. 201]MDV6332760.1 TonB-dependent receptor [Asticcacaulis sp. 201]
MSFKLLSTSALAGVLALLTCAGAPPAMAADEGAQVPGEGAVEVVVTGQKVSRSLQKTTDSVAVTTARKIQDENLQTVYDVFARTANVTETYGGTGFSIRGIRNDSITGGGAGSLSTIYFDGAALPDGAVASAPLDMWDVRQVEVYRGPQSTLQGLNALAGAVIINSVDPSSEWNLKARIMASDSGDRSFAVAGGGPLVTDKLAFRIAAESAYADGLVYNPTRKEYVDESDTLNTRAKLLWTPNADLKVGLALSHIERDGGYLYTYTRTDVPDWYDNRTDDSNSPNVGKNRTDIATLKGDYTLSDRWTLSAVTSWNHVKTYGAYDGDYTAVNRAYGVNRYDDKTFSQELRFNYKGDRLNGLIGLYHVKRDSSTVTASLTNVDLPKTTLANALIAYGLPSATATSVVDMYAAAFPVIPVDFAADTPEAIENAAIFADGTYQLTGKLSLIGGLRYDYEDYTTGTSATAKLSGTYPDPANYGAYAALITALNGAINAQVTAAGQATPASTRSFRAFLPKAGLKYSFTPDITGSITIQRGYRAGGSSVNTARSSVVAYDPEYTWNYEASLRSAWLGGSLIVNANAYYIDWTDQQVLVNLGLNAYDYQTENAGKSHLYGFEVEASQRLSSAFQWYGSLGYSRTKFDDFTVTAGTLFADYTGAEFAYAPHYTLALGGTYRWRNGVFANLNANYTSGAYSGTDVAEQVNYSVDAKTLVNAKIGYETDHWGLYLYVNNLFDERYVSYYRESYNLALPGAPRKLGLSLETRW